MKTPTTLQGRARALKLHGLLAHWTCPVSVDSLQFGDFRYEQSLFE